MKAITGIITEKHRNDDDRPLYLSSLLYTINRVMMALLFYESWYLDYFFMLIFSCFYLPNEYCEGKNILRKRSFFCSCIVLQNISFYIFTAK